MALNYNILPVPCHKSFIMYNLTCVLQIFSGQTKDHKFYSHVSCSQFWCIIYSEPTWFFYCFFSLSQIVQIHKISSALFKESVREEEKGELLLLFLNPYVKTLDLKILFVFMLV